MATLHLLASPDATESCVAAASSEDSLLLLGDGVFALATLAQHTSDAAVGVLQADAESRGITVPAWVEPLSYADFVAWVVACQRSVTWA